MEDHESREARRGRKSAHKTLDWILMCLQSDTLKIYRLANEAEAHSHGREFFISVRTFVTGALISVKSISLFMCVQPMDVHFQPRDKGLLKYHKLLLFCNKSDFVCHSEQTREHLKHKQPSWRVF